MNYPSLSKLFCKMIFVFAVFVFSFAAVGNLNSNKAFAVSCQAGQCNDGFPFGNDCNFLGASCADRNAQACGSRGGLSWGGEDMAACTTPNQPTTDGTTPGTGGTSTTTIPTGATKCDSSPTTATACRNQNFNSDQSGVCTCRQVGTSSTCACVSNSTCYNAGGMCFVGTACSNIGHSVVNGGAGCGNSGVCCSYASNPSPGTTSNVGGSACSITSSCTYLSCSEKSCATTCGGMTIVAGWAANGYNWTADICNKSPVPIIPGTSTTPTVPATQCFGGTAALGYVDHAIRCKSPLDGTGNVCNTNGTWGTTFVNAHACGWTGTAACATDNECKTKGYQVPPVKCDAGVCKNQSGLDFIGCGDIVSGSYKNDPDSCKNCYKTTAGVVNCVRETTSCSARSNCQITVPAPPPGPTVCAAGMCDIGANPAGGRVCKSGNLGCSKFGCGGTTPIAYCTTSGTISCKPSDSTTPSCPGTPVNPSVPGVCGSVCSGNPDCPVGMICNGSKVCASSEFPDSPNCNGGPIITPPPTGVPTSTPTTTVGRCGDGVLNTGEQCDAGPMNGQPGSMCGADCKPTAGVCSAACTTDDQCNQHLVTLVNRVTSTAAPYFNFDAIKEFGRTVETNAAGRFKYTGAWASVVSSVVSGGSTYQTRINGAQVSFLTAAPSVEIMYDVATNRSNFDVYVDGVYKQSVPMYAVTAAYKKLATVVIRPISGGQSCEIRLVNKPVVSKPYFGFDGISEDGVAVGETSTRFSYSPAVGTVVVKNWVPYPLAGASGGTIRYTASASASVSFTTTAERVEIFPVRSASYGSFDIFVNGAFYKNEVATSATNIFTTPVVVYCQKPKYSCVTPAGSTTKVCRLTSNPSDAACKPGATPSPTPAPLACLGVKSNQTSYKYGDMASYTLTPIPATVVGTGTALYEGKCTVTKNGVTVKSFNLTPISAGASQFTPFKVDVTQARYACVFRNCVTKGGVQMCSPWGEIAGSTPAPKPVPTTLPSPPPGCYYQQVQCIQAPCDPILVCPTPGPSTRPLPTPLPTVIRVP